MGSFFLVHHLHVSKAAIEENVRQYFQMHTCTAFQAETLPEW